MNVQRIKLSMLLGLFCLLSACGQEQSSGSVDLIFHSNASYKEKGYPFSLAAEVNGFVFLSGVLGIEPESGELVSGGYRVKHDK